MRFFHVLQKEYDNYHFNIENVVLFLNTENGLL